MVVRRVVSPAAGEKHPELLCTARGEAFPRRGEAILYPAFRAVKIKTVKSLPEGRHLVSVKGAPRKALHEGAILVAGSGGLSRGRIGYGLLSARIPAGRYRLRGGLFRGCELPGTVQIHPSNRGCRFVASSDLPLVPGGRYQILPPGGERSADQGRSPAARGGGQPQRSRGPSVQPASAYLRGADLLLVVPGEVEGGLRVRLLRSLDQLPFDADRAEIYGLILAYLGWVETPADFEGRAALGGIELAGATVVSESYLGHLSKRMVRIVRGRGGAAPREVALALGVPERLAAAVGEELVRRNLLREREGLLLPSGGEIPLSPYERSLYAALRSEALAGRSVESVRGERERSLFAKLERLGLIERLGEAWVASDLLENAGKTLLERRKAGSPLNLESVRELLGVGRREAIDLLGRLTAEGELERSGEEWRVTAARRAKK